MPRSDHVPAFPASAVRDPWLRAGPCAALLLAPAAGLLGGAVALPGAVLLGVVALAGVVAVAGRARRARARGPAARDAVIGIAGRARFGACTRRWIAEGHGLTLALVEVQEPGTARARHRDAAAEEVPRCLRVAAGEGACLARLGQGVFAVAVPGPAGADAARALATRLLRAAGQAVPAAPRLVVGVAQQGARDGVARRAPLLRAARAALADARGAGGPGWRMHDTAMAVRRAARRRLEQALPAAIAGGEIDVFYQPQIRLSDGGAVAFEALVRWRLDGRIVPAGAFVPVAEDAGLIRDLDRLVLARAVREAACWAGGAASPGVSVNLSAASLLAPGLAGDVRALLDGAGLAPGRLTLEITEPALRADWRRAVTVIDAVRRMGVRVALDEFAAGQAGLALLPRVPLDEVKLARGLMQVPETSREARFRLDAVADIAAAHGLSLAVTGVETPAQRDLAADFGCTLAQGFLFGRPVPAAAVRAGQARGGAPEPARLSS